MCVILLSDRLIQSTVNFSLFIYRHGKHQIFLLPYVNDIVVTNTDKFLHTFIKYLGREFDIKDLGPLHYFLGLQVYKNSDRLHINQVKYAHDLLSKHDLLLSKPICTPMSTKADLQSTNGVLLSDPMIYCDIVGSLQYLTIMRPEFSFAIHCVSQFMNQPRDHHLFAVKRIHSLGHGLMFTPQCQKVCLPADSDADWFVCLITRRCTTGY